MLEYVKVTNANQFNKNVKEKGIGYVEEVIRNLLIINDKNHLNDNEVLGFIRYDKFLREKLYKYLSVVEEHLRKKLYKNIEYTGNNLLMYKDDYRYKEFTIIKDSQYGYNFFKKSKLLFSAIVDLYKEFSESLLINEEYSIIDIKNVNNLRNIVMHHSLLVINQNEESPSKTSIVNRINRIEQYIVSVKKVLPKNYVKGLITDINKANLDKGIQGSKSTHIFIKHLEGGYNEI
ncbi:MAG: Abi-like protein [Candidatus Izimaplasma bacterium HR2]|nr:MAG: Abi-like protein [Candidatus Izimaplasma bacterium HR2]